MGTEEQAEKDWYVELFISSWSVLWNTELAIALTHYCLVTWYGVIDLWSTLYPKQCWLVNHNLSDTFRAILIPQIQASSSKEMHMDMQLQNLAIDLLMGQWVTKKTPPKLLNLSIQLPAILPCHSPVFPMTGSHACCDVSHPVCYIVGGEWATWSCGSQRQHGPRSWGPERGVRTYGSSWSPGTARTGKFRVWQGHDSHRPKRRKGRRWNEGRGLCLAAL